MLFALICTDKPGYLETRMNNRPDHVTYLNGLDEAGKLKMAGPTLGTDGKPNGSIVIIDVADQEEAQKVAEGDPYTLAGLFESVDIKPFNWVFKNPDAKG